MIREVMAGAALMLATVLHGTPSARAEEPEAATASELNHVKIRHDVDHLMRLQDEAAAGRRDATTGQKDLLHRIGEALAETPLEESEGLASSLSAYVLSGGEPKIVDRFLKAGGMDPGDQRLLEASSLFMSGDRKAAATLLESIDTAKLPARLAGRIALAQALLAEGAAQQQKYAVAIAAMPGTLIEESALRRSAMAYAEARKEAAFWRRLQRYTDRFHNSVYAAGFWMDATAALAIWSAKGPPPDLARFDTIVAGMAVAERRRIYLSLARQAALLGNSSMAAFAGRRLRRLAVEGSLEDRAGLLYSSIFSIVTDEGDDGLRVLTQIDGRSFAPQEQALLQASLAIVRQIEEPVPTEPRSAAEDSSERDPVYLRGADLLSRSLELLAEAN